MQCFNRALCRPSLAAALRSGISLNGRHSQSSIKPYQLIQPALLHRNNKFLKITVRSITTDVDWETVKPKKEKTTARRVSVLTLMCTIPCLIASYALVADVQNSTYANYIFWIGYMADIQIRVED